MTTAENLWIRAAAPDDAARLARLHAEGFESPWSEQDLRGWLARAEAFAVLASLGGEGVGFALALTAGEDAELLTIVTAREARGRRIAMQVFAALDAEAAARGLSRWVLDVAVDNASAQALYVRLGFADLARRKAYYPRAQGRADARVMARAVGSGGGHSATSPAYVGRAERNGSDSRMRPMIEQKCIERGLRMTDQRRVIARVLSTAADHPDAEELHRRAAAIDPNISLATVYRTVKLFEDSGIIERHDFRDGRSRYEESPEEHHDHLINAKTGEVIEFKSEEIERLQVEIARKLGFQLVDHRLELYGVPLEDGKK
jgi:Fur family ferric uptake transcriptional regulator